jgi:hypothetical protein
VVGASGAVAAEKRVRRALALGSILALAAVPVASGATPVVRSSVSLSSPRFGDTVTYTVAIGVPAAKADSTTVETDVGVLTRVSPPETSRSVERGVVHVVVTERLACLVAQCLTRTGGRVVTIPAARARVGPVELRGRPLLLRIGPRVPLAAVRASEFSFRRPSGAAALTPRADPAMLEALLVAAGLLLVIVGVAGVALPLLRRRELHIPAGRVDPLRRAVRLLRESTTRDGPDRRRAASHAGRLVGQTTVAIDAARVAWSRDDPGPRDVAALADRVERAAGRRE